MIWTVLTVTTRAGAREKLVAYFREQRILAEASRIAGFAGSDLLVDVAGDELVVVSRWQDEQAYRRWLDSGVRRRLVEGLLELIEGSPRTTIFARDHGHGQELPDGGQAAGPETSQPEIAQRREGELDMKRADTSNATGGPV
jgi:heme-degrading monooxygenase HmoA